MKFIKFDIENFKGIKKATVNLEGGRIFTLVGLNEGGKTTLLEAIHSLSPDVDTELVVGGVSTLEEQQKQWVPRDKVGFFTGSIIVSAFLEFEKGDIDSFIRKAKSRYNLDVDRTCLEKDFILTRTTKFENGDFKRRTYEYNTVYQVKSGRQQNYRIAKPEENVNLGNILNSMLPRIAYFPTFVFDFPNKIYLTEGKGDRINNYYKKLFQDILDYDGNKLKIGKNIVDRIRTPEAKLPWADFITWLSNSDEKLKIDPIVARAGQAITQVVFDTWKEIFKEDRSGREIFVGWGVEEGSNNNEKDENGNEIATTEHDLYVTIELKQGTQRFEIKDRSLGFRWFFTFLLFTQFRVGRNDGRPIVFLFDEPASNLHAAAQEKLVESFSKIAIQPHIFIYTTHSHYMIEPKWLEQTYIVQNGGVDDDGKLLSEATREDSDIKAIKYRNFVNSNPSDPSTSSVSYFQPIMDRLNIAPSKFDYDKRGVILEGKSDYFIFRYLSEVHFKKKINFFPGVGATTLDPLISLQKGWGLPVLVLLDSDKAGKNAKQAYIDKYFLKDSEIVCLGDLVDGLTEIENLLEQQDRDMIKTALSLDHNPNKKNICQFFQEKLAADKKIGLSNEMTEKAKKLLEAIEKLTEEQIQD